MKWKKSREAAVLAAAVLLCGGMYSVQAEETYFGDRTTHELGEVHYTDLAVDNAGTVVNIGTGSTIIGQNNGDLSTEGGTINMTGTAVTGTGLWANEKKGEAGGTITMNGGSVDGGDVYAQGNSTITLNGTKVTNVGTVGMTQTVIADNEQTMTGESAGKVTFTGGAQATVGKIEATGANGMLTVSGGASVTAGSLTMKPMEENGAGSEVSIDGGTLNVTGAVDMTGSSMTVYGNGALTVGGNMSLTGGRLDSDGTTKLGSLNASGSDITVDSTLNVTGNASLDNSTLDSDGTMEVGSLTVKNQSTVADDNTLTVTGNASLDNSTLTANGKTTLGSLTAGNGSTVTVNEGKTLDVTGNASLDGSKLIISTGTMTAGSLTAGNKSTVNVNGTLTVAGDVSLTGGSSVSVIDDKALTVDGNVSLTDSTFVSNGTTKLESLTSTGNSGVAVNGGTFEADTVNTNLFEVTDGTVTINGGTMTGDVGTKEDGSDGKSALWIHAPQSLEDGATEDGVTDAEVTAKNVTFTGGEVAVDNGGILNLKGGTVDVPTDYFTTEGGTITTDGTTIKSGIWAHDSNGKDGIVTLNNSTLSGGTIGAQDGSEITMNGGTADVDNVWLETGTITFDQNTDGKGAVVTADAITAKGDSNTLAILNGSAVVAGSLTVADGNLSIKGNLTVEGTDLLDDAAAANPGSLTITGTTTLSNGKTLTVEQGASTNFAGTVNVGESSSIAVTGADTSATFASGSKLYADSSAPAVTVSDNAKLTFAAGSSVYTTASETAGQDDKYTVNTVAKVASDSTGTITVDEDASLFVQNLDKDKTYSLDNVIQNGSGSNQEWSGNVYGKNKLQIIDKETGAVENQSVSEAYKGAGILAAGVYDAAILASEDKATAASDFIENVTTNRGEEKADDARIANALNSHTGMTGLAGAGYGTYRFTTAFTDAAANHEEGDLWASYLHDKSSVDGLSVGSLSADYDLTFDGAIVGSDFYRKGNTTIGAAFAYADGDISTKSGVSTENDVDYYGGMIYGSVKGAAGMTYRAEIGYNRSSNDITQTNTGTVITGSVDADAFHVGVSAEKEILSSTGTWTPFVGLQYIDLSMDDYSDSLGFRHEGDSAGIWNMPLGVNYKYEMERGGWTYAPAVTVGYRFTFGDDSLNETLRYNGTGSTFGTEIAEDSFFTRIGLTAKKDNLGFGVHYGYERGSNTEANQWGIDCSFYF